MTDLEKHEGAVEWLCRRLRDGIAAGEYPAGRLLPSERDIVRQTGITRTLVRQALTRLEEENLISRAHGKGSRVQGLCKDGRPMRVAILYPVRFQQSTEQRLTIEAACNTLARLGVTPERIPFGGERPSGAGNPDMNHFTLFSDIHTLAADHDGFLHIELNTPCLIAQIEKLVERDYPVVVANLELELPFAATRVDHADVARRAVEFLASLGHQRIGYVGNAPDYLFYGRTLAGYREGLQAAGLPFEERSVEYQEPGPSLNAYLAMSRLLKRGDPPTAIVASRDYAAQGACTAIQEAGLEVGHDISVVGYDDLSWEGDSPLTTFREPRYELGAVAASLLVERLRHGPMPSEQRILPAELVIRRTAGPPRSIGFHDTVR